MDDRLLASPDISFQIGITEKVKCIKQNKISLMRLIFAVYELSKFC